MKKPETAFIGLGSNLENRLQLLQLSIFALARQIGPVTDISNVYETDAEGFEGPSFLNAVVRVTTTLNPYKVLDALLDIERSLGRIRNAPNAGYQSRKIDLDLLLFGTTFMDNEGLSLPHPRLHLRAFVLAPICDLTPDGLHPILGLTYSQLLENLKIALPKPVAAKLYISRRVLYQTKIRLLTVEGNIGAGKTTLAQMIASEFNAKLILERFADNPFLPKFYEDKTRYAFALEMSFLADRYQQFTEDTSQFDLFKTFMVSDYDIYKSLIFSKITLTKEEFDLYRKMFFLMYKEVQKPDVYLYLHRDTSQLLFHIKKRGRGYEQNIKPDYLETINKGYMDFIKTKQYTKTVILNAGNLDFVANEKDLETVFSEIDKVLLPDFSSI